MKATIEYVEQRFRYFNDVIFEGKLPPVPVRISGARSFLGKICYTRRCQLFDSWIADDFQLVISNRFDVPQSMLDDVIIHEMIHYYILHNRIQDTSSHGKVFRSVMNSINAKFARNVSIRTPLPKEVRDSDKSMHVHIICVSFFQDGTTGITLAAHTRVPELKRAIPRIPSLDRCEWYVSQNPFFNRFPRSITMKIYRISPQELKENLKDATRVE